MRVTKYKMSYDRDRKPELVKESASNYSAVSALNAPDDIVDLMDSMFHASDMPEEYVWLIAMDTKLRVIGVMEISHGGSSMTYASNREVFWRLCMCGATCFSLVHNHPSGDPTPSDEDKKMTTELNNAAKTMDIQLIDHIIIGDRRYYSFKRDGKI